MGICEGQDQLIEGNVLILYPQFAQIQEQTYGLKN